MSYVGVVNTINVEDAVIFDLGGGSTEVILVRKRKLIDSVSLPIGRQPDKAKPAGLYARPRRHEDHAEAHCRTDEKRLG